MEKKAPTKITYTSTEVLKAGELYIGSNGAELLLVNFWFDFEGGLMLTYQVKLNGKWVFGDMTPNSFYHWVFPCGKYAPQKRTILTATDPEDQAPPAKPAFNFECTPSGEQFVIPGCEKRPTKNKPQGELF